MKKARNRLRRDLVGGAISGLFGRSGVVHDGEGGEHAEVGVVVSRLRKFPTLNRRLKGFFVTSSVVVVGG